MFFWSKFPFVRVALFLVAGILIGVFIPNFNNIVVTVLVILLVLLLFFVIRRKPLLLKFNSLYGLVISLIFLSFGYTFLISSTEKNKSNHINHLDSINFYTARVISDPLLKGNFLRMKVEVETTNIEEWINASGKVFLYIKQPVKDFIEIGDKLLIKGSPKAVRSPLNPMEFDYRQYLAFNNIHHQQFVSEGQWVLFEKSSGHSILSMSIKARNKLESILVKYITGPEELAIAKALILGNKEDLDKPTKEVYAKAGAMHVLAVSGLHVGIIYMVLLFVLGQRKSNGSYSAWVAAIVILVLWTYAFITGLSPSVLRAVTMFSFLALAQAFNRKSNSINTLAISAIILLLVNPYMIMYVGFQLSYVAVIGIILMYPKVQSWFTPSNWVLRMIWQITAISLVAQLVTSPLSAYYFHRFPTYFFISNLIIIPAATVIVWGGLALLAFGSIASTFGLIIGGGLKMLIHAVNSSLQWVSSLPWADINDLAPAIHHTLLLYGLIIFMFLYTGTKRLIYFRAMIVLVFVLGISMIVTDTQNRRIRQIVFYSVSNSWAIDFIENKSYSSMADSLLIANRTKLDYQITPYRRYHSLASSNEIIKTKLIPDLGEIAVWHSKKILLANPCIKPEDIPGYFDFVLYKTDQSDAKCYQEQILLRKLVDNQGAGYEEYNLRSNGALIVDI